MEEKKRKISPDQIISDLGGCGPFQMRISFFGHAMKCLICWSTTSMVIFSMTPPWWCNDIGSMNKTTDNSAFSTPGTSGHVITSMKAVTDVSFDENITSSDSRFQSCSFQNGQSCTKYKFSGSSTLVSEFDLVCENAFVTSLMMTIQGAGSFVGNIIAGQISDLFGRKRPFFTAVAVVTLANFVGYFTKHWALFAATRFFVGVGATAFMTTLYSLLNEFSLARHRAWVTGVPSWPIEACLFVGVAYWLQEWRHIQLACALIGIPALLTWWIMPESFRWYLAHDRHVEAERVLRTVARVNKKPVISLQQLEEIQLVEGEEDTDRKYTFLDIFKSKSLVKLTIFMGITWTGMGFVSYGIVFGIQALPGDVFMNLFVFSLVGIPTKAITSWLENKIGRRQTAMLCYLIVALGGLGAGISYYIDTVHRAKLITGFALLAYIGTTTIWGPVQTMTIELYPTVIRSIGFGFQSTMARIGGMIGPQFVYLSTMVPGLLFFASCGVSLVCILAQLGLAETKDAYLTDKITKQKPKTKTSTLSA